MKTLASIVSATVLLALGSLAQAGGTVLIVTHEVKDFAAWKTGFDSDKPSRDKAGLVQRYLLRDADKPNVVTVVFEAPTAKAAHDFSTNPALKDAMMKAGVVSAPAITIGNKAN